MVDVAPFLQGHVISEQLKRDVQKQWIKFWLGGWYFKHCIHRDRKAPWMGDGDDRSAPCEDFLDRRDIFAEKMVARNQDDRGRLGRNQRQWPVLQFGRRVSLCVEVANL